METAIIVAVPEAEPIIDRWRRQYTSDGADGMPAHITLLYPFADTSQYAAQMGHHVGSVLAGRGPIAFSLTETAYFEGNPRVLYLVPDPADPFAEMTNALAAEFPAYRPYGGAHATVVPHVTVAVHDDKKLLARIEEEVAAELPIKANASEARMMEHAPMPDGWRLRRAFPLV